MLEPAAQPLPPKPPDLPAVGTRLFYAEDEDNEAFYATVTKHRLSKRAVPGQWIVEFCGDDDGEWAGAMGRHLQLQSPPLRNGWLGSRKDGSESELAGLKLQKKNRKNGP